MPKSNKVALPFLTARVQTPALGSMGLLWAFGEDSTETVWINGQPVSRYTNPGRRFFSLSYEVENPMYGGQFAKGTDDAYFVLMTLFVFIIARLGIMKLLAKLFKLSGAGKARSQQRFAEQMYLVIFYVISFHWGLDICQGLPTWGLHFEHFWIGYPHLFLSPQLKRYYLVELGFWLHEFVALLTEARRKDFWEMLSHHCVTTGLVLGSYALNYHRVGNMILLLFDIADILLSGAKSLLYLEFRKSADVTFGIFVLTWFISRHVLFGSVIWSVVFDAPKYLEERWDVQAGYFYSTTLQVAFSILLLALQGLVYFWFYLIIKVVYKTLTGEHADDNRSDTEGSDEEGDKKEK